MAMTRRDFCIATTAAAAGGPEYAVSKFPFAANGKAMTMQETSGFAKLICRKEDGKSSEEASSDRTRPLLRAFCHWQFPAD